jgi:hypothetical protein
MEINSASLRTKIINSLEQGYCSLPEFSIKSNKNFESKFKHFTYKENTQEHIDYLERSGISSNLKPILEEVASNILGYSFNPNDLYLITRSVSELQASEAYRGHFDSHIFTLVTPISIPHEANDIDSGELILFNNFRKEPTNEISNVLQKIKYKKYSSKASIRELQEKYSHQVIDFADGSPVLFLGRRSFHCNKPFRSKSGENRITMLTHFYDPSPTISIGGLNRFLRKR